MRRLNLVDENEAGNWRICSDLTAVKMHILQYLRGAIPEFIQISDGKIHEVNVLDFLLIKAGAFYIMDRSYTDFDDSTKCISAQRSSLPTPSET